MDPQRARSTNPAVQKCFSKQVPGIQPWDRKEGQEKRLSSPLPNDALVILVSHGVATCCPPNNTVLGGHIPTLSSRTRWHCGSQGHANIQDTPSAL